MTQTSEGRAPGDSGRPALSRCINLPVGEFADRYWGRAALLSPAETLPGDFADLLSLEAVDELLSRRGLRTPFVRLAKDGQVVPTGRYTRGGGAGAAITDQVADDRVLDLVVDGSTVVLQGLHRTWPPLVDFATRLAVDLGHPVQVNAYITPPQSQGFSPHYDVHDVFVLQVAGEKHWTIHEPVLETPLRDQPWTDHREAVRRRAEEAPVIDTVLRPGDALYLPRGYLHSATALGGVSAHLTVGVHAVTRYAVAEALLVAASDDPALRGSLPLGLDLTDAEALRDEVATTVRALLERLEGAQPEEVVAALRRTVWPQTRPEPLGPLAVAAAVASLDKGSRVRARLGVRASVRTEESGVVVDLGERQVSLPAGSEEAVRALLAGGPVGVGELPGLGVDEQVDLVRRVLREGLVVPVEA
ncbi:MAG TPA: cupin domain-containing protein [Jiangellales bacterium]|nr:cupin domain-containing protein [Jiangellales bacterium]